MREPQTLNEEYSTPHKSGLKNHTRGKVSAPELTADTMAHIKKKGLSCTYTEGGTKNYPPCIIFTKLYFFVTLYKGLLFLSFLYKTFIYSKFSRNLDIVFLGISLRSVLIFFQHPKKNSYYYYYYNNQSNYPKTSSPCIFL